ncbi:hypothetical protein [Phytoactinopolyspora endophytica]|uniref:hypothetical protein n=1 Tax=Phytoactinopolyspora endophytica TaxID=1642495 RepID=UPI00101DC78D|nr:hypothetical protein [Phytoactinopolyspora endophytica]
MNHRLPCALALFVSLCTAIAATVWLTTPDSYPYGSGDIVRTGFNYLIEREAGVAIALTAAAAGVLLAIAGMVRPAARVLAVGAVAEALCFAFVLGDGSILAALGYAVALTLPVAAVVALVLVGRRRPPIGLPLAAIVMLLGVAGLANGTLTLSTLGDAVANYYSSFLNDPEGYYPRMAWTLGWLIGAAVWTWAAVTSMRVTRSDNASERTAASRVTAAARRWGRRATIAAALCPVPYGLCRLMWLTPWPLGGDGVDEFVITRSLDIETRLRGFLFAPAVAIGVVLTLGLISRWGEVFPRWFPVVGGRAVPVMLAVVPGGLVASVITLAGPVSLVDYIEYGDPLESAYGFFFMPFPIWGPLLGLAVFAYWLRRTREPQTPAPDGKAGSTHHAVAGA